PFQFRKHLQAGCFRRRPPPRDDGSATALAYPAKRAIIPPLHGRMYGAGRSCRHLPSPNTKSWEEVACMANVVIRDVRKAYGSTEVIHGVSIDIPDGEFVVLVGPSGCGKSTLLRMIAGLEQITGGHIAIGERVVNNLPPKERDIAMVFQNYALYPHMTVSQN